VKGPSSKGAAVVRPPADHSRQTRPVAHVALRTVGEFSDRAQRFNSLLTAPVLETTVTAIDRSVTNTIRRATLVLEQIGSCRQSWVTFANTVSFLDDIFYEINLTVNRLRLIQDTSTNAALRQAAMAGIQRLSGWSASIWFREDVHKAVNRYAAGMPRLCGEDEKLFREVLRDYKRAGFGLSKPVRIEVETMRTELARLVADFESQISLAQQSVKFTRGELAGVPQDFLGRTGIETGKDEFTIQANVAFQYRMVMENARLEGTRRKLAVAEANLARQTNAPLLQRIVELRDTVAKKLGYATWADYQIEPRMAQSASNALAFCERLQNRIRPRFAAELETFRQMKVRDTGDAAARIQDWDWRYYVNQLKKERFGIDSEALRTYFPYEKCLAGLMRICEEIFGLKFEPLEVRRPWCADLQLFAVSDEESGEPLGLLYLDMFPREGKFTHSAQYPIIDGKLMPGGKYQRPTVALVCNFPPPTGGKPCLLSHQEVETLFHEFGHALHSILTRAKFGRFSGGNGPRDFVEAPSQVLENWAWDRRVLDTFAADYRDPSKKIPREMLARMKEAKRATAGTCYSRQLSLALLDLSLHTQVTADNHRSIVDLSNQVLADNFLPPPPDTAVVASFGHLANYDAGYYGYAWADVIAADLASVFEKSWGGFLDARAGRKLREEIYAPGDSRDPNCSIERFLERKQSIEPFWNTLGMSVLSRASR
jgi:Zn-dependent oligopeptidase